MFEEEKKEFPTEEPKTPEITEKDLTKGPMIAIPKEFVRKRRKLPKIFLFLVILVVLVGAIFLFSYLKILRLEQRERSLLNQPVITPEVPSQPEPQISDTDGDGLTDDEEQTLGTEINLPDTDQDGLFDKEEVKIYGTSPLNQDTDTDGYQDGEEVKAGYDPKDPSPQAKLFDLKTEIEKIK